MSQERYARYLPEVVENFRQFRILSKVEGETLQESVNAKERLEQNQWIQTSHREGLTRRAEMMGLDGEWGDIEDFREAVLFHWNSRSPYTYYHLLEWLDGYCGKAQYLAGLNRGEYQLKIILELAVKAKKELLFKRLRQMIPANLLLLVLLNANTHRKISPFTHKQLKEAGLAYGTLPLEALEEWMHPKEI